MKSLSDVVVVTNRKGGTGKTTTAVNVAAEFAARGLKVLVIDLDTQGHCAVGLGIAVKRGEPTVHHLFDYKGFKLSDAVRATEWPNLHLAPANPLFEHNISNKDYWALVRAFKEEKLREVYDLIILDTPPSLDSLMMNALLAGSHVLIPFVPHPLASEGIKNLARILFKVSSGPNPGLKLLALLPIMISNRVRQHGLVKEGISKQFGDRRLLSGIRRDIKLAEAFAYRKPIREYAPKSRGAEDYAIATKEIAPRLGMSL